MQFKRVDYTKRQEAAQKLSSLVAQQLVRRPTTFQQHTS